MKENPFDRQEKMETSGSLTPELTGSRKSRPHPFRYAGQQTGGAAPRGTGEHTEDE